MRRTKRKEGLLKKVIRVRITNKKLIKNKLYSILIMLLGYVSMKVIGEGTVFLFTLLIGLPIFFAKENVME